MTSKESNDTNLKTLSMDDERPVVVSDGTKKVVRLLVATNELYGGNIPSSCKSMGRRFSG